MMRQLILPFLFLVLFCGNARATHIVGGEITYQCLGNDQYQVTLTVYRDCFNGIPWFDNPAHIGVYDAQWNLITDLALPIFGASDTIPVELVNPCLTVPPNVCVNRLSYTTTVSLPFSPGGYTLVYQRCCRNQLIKNIVDPLNTGISIVAEIDELALQNCNGGAVFNNWPPVAICVNEPIDFDHSASDPDGDSLVYRLCTPLNGPDSLNPLPVPPFAGPYEEVVWVDPPYNLSNVLGGDPLTIDPATGFMTGVPSTIGNFVVGVCVDEYRNDELISTTRRDFQYNVADCGEPTAAFFSPEIVCDTLAVKFTNQSSNATFFRWYFDWPNPQPSSVQASPIHTFPDTGTYVIALIADPIDMCRDTFLQEITLSETFADASVDIGFQDCDSTGLTVQALDMSSDPIFGINGWSWLLTQPDGTTQQSNLQMPDFVVNQDGDYQLRLIATGGNGCPDTAFTSFNAEIPQLDNLQDTFTICAGDTIALNPNFNPDYQYLWTPDQSLTDGSAPNPSAFPNVSTAYSVAISTSICDRVGQVWVEVIDPGTVTASAIPDRVYEGELTQLSAELTGSANFSWEPADLVSDPSSQNPTSNPTETTTYTVSAALDSGCSGSATVTVTVLSPECEEPYIFFPTGFTPNGDGNNDELKLEGRFVEEVYWVIYSRWGQKMFEAFSVDDAWDGRFEGEEMPAETYGYYLRVLCPGGEEYVKKGNVSLLR